MPKKTTPLLFYVYLVIAGFALLLTWLHVPSYLGMGFIAGNVQFWQDALTGNTPAGNFLTVDLLFLVLATNLWMIVESRRIHLRWVWLYIAIGVFIGISFAFPLYLAMRERLISAQTGNLDTPLKQYDILGILFLAVITLTISVWLYVG